MGKGRLCDLFLIVIVTDVKQPRQRATHGGNGVVLVLDVPKPRQAPVKGRSRARARRGFERLRRQGKVDRAGGCGARRARGIGLLDGLPLTRGRHPRLCGAPADAVGGQGVTMHAW